MDPQWLALRIEEFGPCNHLHQLATLDVSGRREGCCERMTWKFSLRTTSS
jgi:hypothetical protein